jgi:hypothetical protein
MAKHRVHRHDVPQPDNPSYRLIPLTQNQNALVDTDDYDWLMQWNWFAHRNRPTATFYAWRRGPDTTQISMQEEITGRKDIDHRNRNGLDNRKANLRACTVHQNARNRGKAKGKTSKYLGVSWDSDCGKWKAEITPNRTRIRLGRFISEKQAAEAYDAAALEHFGEFACLNFPQQKRA